MAPKEQTIYHLALYRSLLAPVLKDPLLASSARHPESPMGPQTLRPGSALTSMFTLFGLMAGSTLSCLCDTSDTIGQGLLQGPSGLQGGVGSLGAGGRPGTPACVRNSPASTPCWSCLTVQLSPSALPWVRHGEGRVTWMKNPKMN